MKSCCRSATPTTAALCAGALLFFLSPESANSQKLQRLADDLTILRGKIDGSGVTLETVNTTDFLANVAGGRSRESAIVGDLDLLLTLDAEKLVGWEEADFFVYGLGLYGKDPSEFILDAQGVSNIAGPNTWKVFEGWYQQNFLDEQFSLLVGLYDVTSEFDVVRAPSELFVNSSFGTNPTFGLSGINGPSTFPTTSLGIRGQAKLTEGLTLRAVVTDGVPGDLNDSSGTKILLRSEDGVLVTTELAYYIGKPELVEEDRKTVIAEKRRRLVFRRLGRAAELEYDAKFALGVWYYSTEFPDLSEQDAAGNPAVRDGTYGIYGLGETFVYYEAGDVDQGLSLFAQVGYADPQVNRFEFYVGGGGVYTGLIPGRDLDQTGFAFGIARNGRNYEAGLRNAGQDVRDQEVVLEFTHAAYLTKAIVIQPDLQYIIHPGTDPTIDNALVLGLRLELALNWFK